MSIFLQFFPPSSVIWIKPSSVPIAIRFESIGDSDKATMVPYGDVDPFFSTASMLTTLSYTLSVFLSICLDKSSLITSQLFP